MRFSLVNTKERTEAIRSVAFDLDMDFHEKDEFKMIALLRDFKLFQKGGRRTAFNILSKTSGLLEEKVNILDYRYTVSTGKSSHTFFQTVFFIQSKQLSLPQMLLKPEKFFHKIGAWLGMQDIDFEEYQEFSDKNLLQGEDEDRIRKTLKANEEVIRFFTVEKDWCLESLGFYMILYKDKTLIEPASIKHLFQKGKMLHDYLKTEPW
ncbi:MAG: hypothetical protein H6577_07400 [Lewinellaceae bacterium]|nr:hypothetical protein [Saprospiraceae bacterium]MCB9337937.1 hypothetical protein [Lewinellaceae bacterium]